MKKVKLTVEIKKSVSVVFEFLLNPKNTPLWIDGVAKEETSEWPVKKGTKYRNHGGDEKWNEYRLAEYEPNKSFELVKSDNNYHVRYTFKELGKDQTEFTYHEWVEDGEIGEPFTQDILEKLKHVMEQK